MLTFLAVDHFAFAHRPDDLAVDYANYFVLQLGFHFKQFITKKNICI
jgi:hypothetical protein